VNLKLVFNCDFEGTMRGGQIARKMKTENRFEIQIPTWQGKADLFKDGRGFEQHAI
jgi:hypothetical protein